MEIILEENFEVEQNNKRYVKISEQDRMQLEELRVADFDVTGDFSIEDTDKALEKVSAGRSKIGAKANA